MKTQEYKQALQYHVGAESRLIEVIEHLEDHLSSTYDLSVNLGNLNRLVRILEYVSNGGNVEHMKAQIDTLLKR